MLNNQKPTRIFSVSVFFTNIDNHRGYGILYIQIEAIVYD